MTPARLDDHFALAVAGGHDSRSRSARNELPPAREPATRGARRRRLRYCLALALAALMLDNPVALGARRGCRCRRH